MRVLVMVVALIALAACKKPSPDASDSTAADATPPNSASAAPPAASSAPSPPPAASSGDPSGATNQMGDSPFAAGDAWNGSYSCRGNAGATSLQLRIERGAPTVSAVFGFTTKAKKSGSFNMSGTYDPASRRLHLTPGSWIQRPAGFIPVSLDGTLSADGHTLSGSVLGAPGCSSFTVHR